MSAHVVLSTIDDADKAHALAAQWVEARLAACVQIIPGVSSTYHWKGRIEHSQELILLIKLACADNELENRIVALAAAHPYEEPEFVALDVAAGSPGYLRWLSAWGGA